MMPMDFVEVFKSKFVTDVVRLNAPEYNASDFTQAGVSIYVSSYHYRGVQVQVRDRRSASQRPKMQRLKIALGFSSWQT